MEVRELIPVTLFFFVAFQLLALTQALMLKEYGIRVTTFVAATIMAMIVAKVVVLTRPLRAREPLPGKTARSTTWSGKTVIYFVASLVVRYVEHIIHFWRQSGGLCGGKPPAVFSEIVWPHFWAVQLWLLILLFVYMRIP